MALAALLALSTLAPADEVYLFSSFRGNGEDGLHLALSTDGLKWTALRGDKPFFRSDVAGKLMRDPCIAQGPDGTFHCVWTTGWTGHTIGYASSKDLRTWTQPRGIPVMEHEPTCRNAWAPELCWDAAKGVWVIFWASTVPGRFTVGEKTGDGGYNHRMYCLTTPDFATFSPTRLFYDPGFNVIDATLTPFDGKWLMVLKDETKSPVKKHLRLATADSPQGPFGAAGEPFTPPWVEGPTVLKVGDDWLVYYDCYSAHHYGAMRTRDFKTFTDVTQELSFPRDTRHGTAFRVPKALADALAQP